MNDKEEQFLNDWPDGTPKSFGNDFTAHWDSSPEEDIKMAKILVPPKSVAAPKFDFSAWAEIT